MNTRRIDRRRFLAGTGLGTAAIAFGSATPTWGVPTPDRFDLGDGIVIRPRSDWAGALAPTGPLVPEPEVRFLLVHHTVNDNSYALGDVVGLLQDIFHFHTGPEKGWHDVAYNFFVDRFGGVWEGRQGSIDGAVQGDATGGNQGSSQLCSFIGDHTVEPPTPEAINAMTHLLAWLGEREDIDTSPGATTTFVSRGSNLWAPGEQVTATTIAGHREMSSTACPGDAAFTLVKNEFPQQVTDIRLGRALSSSDATTTTTPSVATTSPVAPSTTAARSEDGDESAATASGTSSTDLLGKALIAGGVVGAAVVGALWARMRLINRR